MSSAIEKIAEAAKQESSVWLPSSAPANFQPLRVLKLMLKKDDCNEVTIVLSEQPLRFAVAKRDGAGSHLVSHREAMVVKMVDAGSQADMLGMKVGMVLIAIDGQYLYDWNFSEQFGLIRAKAKMLQTRHAYYDDPALGA
eukprot:gnl/TRDRNA2_/TRDRNA2_71795_c1_seq1.p1 gnl/TRDRNA2_/TRDRNA2_71795_c1~~gnl/TRDRNA2_/TRDRNA2_71795_c1_seq1.p1  ORF type:complete len:150 (+),score=27.58 gnl/TRDRNA2_/TRDRNA2_71795_c1_seq1:33-452(+)